MSDLSATGPFGPHPTVVLHATSSRALGGVMMGIAAFATVATAFDDADSLLRYGGAFALFGLLGWAAFWQPHISVSDGGVIVVNTLRTIEVPWPAIEEVEGRYGLKLLTAYGPVSAWGAGAPTGRSRARAQQSEASALVGERLSALRAAGYLDDPRLERPRLVRTWHTPVVVALIVLAAATALLPLLA